ncbi:MAG: EamA family transporter [Rhodospirillales bacterium]
MADRQVNLGIEIPLLCLLALLWGSSYLFVKIAVDTIPPITLIASRVTIAAVLLCIIVHAKGETYPRDRRTLLQLLVQATLNSIVPWIMLAWGQQYVDSGLASVLNSTSPLFVFFITLIFTRHETTSALKLIGACLGVAGVMLIVGTDALQGLGQQVVAQLAILVSAMLYACAAIYGKKFAHLSATVTAACIMIWAAMWLIPLSLLIEQPWTLTPSTRSLGAALALGVLCTGVALLIYFRLIKTLGSLGVASQGYLRAGVGVMLGIVVLGEHITPMIALGIGAALLGVIAINFPARKQDLRP